MRFQISQSELGTFRTCRQKWWLQYGCGLASKTSSDAMHTGSIAHKGIAVLYASMKVGLAKEPALALALQMVAESSATDTDFTTSEGVGDTADDLVVRYADAFYERDAIQYEVIYVEQPFQLPIRWSENGKRKTVPGARFIGAADVVLRDRVTGEYVVMEHKTTGSDATSFDARFEVDPQTPGYVWASAAMLDPAPVSQFGRVVINAIRRGGPKQPKVNLDGKVSTAACDTTHGIYQAALDEQVNVRGIPVTDKQVEVVTALPRILDKWTCRHEWKYSAAELERWRSELIADARLLRQARSGKLAHTRNGSSCANPWNPRCDMRDACVMGPDRNITGSLYDIRGTSFSERMDRLFRRDQ